MTWTDARKHCREQYTDLATVNDMADTKRLVTAAGAGFTGRVWIGLYDQPKTWAWSLSDKAFYGEGEQDFKNWQEREPNNLLTSRRVCVTSFQGWWRDQSCVLDRTFVCYNNTDTSGEQHISLFIQILLKGHLF